MNSRILIAIVLVLFSNYARTEADGPDTWRVTHIESGSFLNMRKGPSVQFEIVARIPHNAIGLENHGCSPQFDASEWAAFTAEESKLALAMRWCRIEYSGSSGWVHSKYLKE